jgi:hypothetical protein
MKLKILALCSLLAASVAVAQEKPAVVEFNDLVSNIDSMKGKEVALHGGVDLVSSSKGMFTISELGEAGCADGCAKVSIVASLPENLRAQLPKSKDEVVAFGKLEQSGRGYMLAVTRLVVGQDQIKSLAAVQGSRPGDNLGHDAQPLRNP